MCFLRRGLLFGLLQEPLLLRGVPVPVPVSVPRGALLQLRGGLRQSHAGHGAVQSLLGPLRLHAYPDQQLPAVPRLCVQRARRDWHPVC